MYIYIDTYINNNLFCSTMCLITIIIITITSINTIILNMLI